MELQAGDLVTRKSYQHDLLFRIKTIKQDVAILYGEAMRLIADAEISDLVKVNDRDLEHRRKAEQAKEEFYYRLFRQEYQLMKEKRNYKTTKGYQVISYLHILVQV